MDVENLAGEAEAKWYGLDAKELDREKYPKRAGVLIRNLTPGRTRELRKQSMTFVWTGQRTVPMVDEDALHKLMLHDCVLDWANFDKGGEPFKCNRENRDWMDDNSKLFNALWQALAQKENTRTGALDEPEEDEEKKDPDEEHGELGNSGNGGATTSPTATSSGSTTASSASVEKSPKPESCATGTSPEPGVSAP